MFSIIIPVYNSERYLERCILSVYNQTYSDWELIIIDDGSTDSSWNIIKKYSLNDSRIHGIKQKNAGPGVARNVGLQAAKGDYIVFIDSDDYVVADYLELANRYVEKCDFLFIDVQQVDENGIPIKEEKMSIYKEMDKEVILRRMMTGYIPWGGVRKIIRAELLKDNNIQYTNLKVGEEALFSFRALNTAKKVAFLDEKPVYMYVIHKGSQSSLKLEDPWGEIGTVLKQYLLAAGLYKKFADTLNALNIAATVISIDKITNMYTGRERKKRINKRMEQYTMMYDHNYKIDIQNLCLKAKIFIPFLKIKWLFPISLCSKLRIKIKLFGKRFFKA